MADDNMLSKGEGHTGGFAEAQPDHRRFPQTSELTGGSRYPGSSSRLIKLNINTISDPIEADTRTSVLAQSPPLRHEASKDQDVIDENSESDGFGIKHFQSPLEDRRLNARGQAKETILFSSLLEDRLVFGRTISEISAIHRGGPNRSPKFQRLFYSFSFFSRCRD